MSQQSTAGEEVRAALERTLGRAPARIGFRRVRHTSGGTNAATRISTLDLTELGIELCSDWSHLPAGAGIEEHDRP